MRGRGKGSKGIVVTATRIPISFCVEFLTREEANQEKFFLLACLPSLNDRFRSCLSRLFSLVYKIYKGDLLQAILWNARANDVIDSHICFTRQWDQPRETNPSLPPRDRSIFCVFYLLQSDQIFCKGASINYVSRQGGGWGLGKCLCYYISLCSKVAYGGGRGVKNWQNLAYVVYGWPL